MTHVTERTGVTGPDQWPANVDTRRWIALGLTWLGLLVMMLTLQPFSVVSESLEASSGGNLVNQIGFVALGLIYMIAIARLTPRALRQALLSPAWALVLVIMLLSLTSAYDPAAAFRGIVLTVLAMAVVAGVLVLPPTERDFGEAVSWTALIVLAVVYAAVMVAPHLAIHSAEGFESWHAGLWRAHLMHKNFAAPLFSMIAMTGIYCWWAGLKLRGAIIAVLAGIIVFNTGSKTTFGFLPLAIGLVLLGRMWAKPTLAVAAHAGLFLIVSALTVGTIYLPALKDIVAALTDDVTFTGRDEIWRFAIARIAETPFFGHGYGSFWMSPTMRNMEINHEASWDVRGIVSGHNNYIDLVLTFGIPGGLILIYILMVRPLVHYIKASRAPGNRNLADLFAMIVIFTTYGGLLETFLLNRSDPLWVMTALAIVGLGLLARLGLNAGAQDQS